MVRADEPLRSILDGPIVKVNGQYDVHTGLAGTAIDLANIHIEAPVISGIR
ncbi:hypothetical protein ES703_101717 [subsurface metagenome]